MFGFLAALGPVGMAAAAIGTVATVIYAASSSDDDEIVTSSNKLEKEREAKRESEKEKDALILNDIEKYKEKERKRFKRKYNANIEFKAKNGEAFSGPVTFLAAVAKGANDEESIILQDSELDNLSKSIKDLERKKCEMLSLVQELEGLKNE